MALVVEDGTGLSTANSLVAVAEADTYHGDRSHTDWTGATTAAKEAALIKASDYLSDEERFCWVGTKSAYTQTMPWPRAGAVERRGPAIPANVVPWRVKHACFELALRSIQGVALHPDLERGGRIKTETVGPISTTYMDDAPAVTVIQAAVGVLKPLLRPDVYLELAPSWYDGGGASFSLGMHDNPGDE